MVDTSFTIALGIILLFITLSAINYFTDYENIFIDRNIQDRMWKTLIGVVLLNVIIKFSGKYFECTKLIILLVILY